MFWNPIDRLAQAGCEVIKLSINLVSIKYLFEIVVTKESFSIHQCGLGLVLEVCLRTKGRSIGNVFMKN